MHLLISTSFRKLEGGTKKKKLESSLHSMSYEEKRRAIGF